MPARNQNFYNLQQARRYPLDDLSTGTDNDGVRLRDNILVDLHIRFPDNLGKVLYVSGISITERLVTLTFFAADSVDAAASFVPAAAITLVKPVVENRQYLLEPLYPGVGGWVVFGQGISEDFRARFSSPRQSLVLARCANAYRPLPIPNMGKLFRDTSLTGLVTIKAGADLEIVKEPLTIGGIERDAMVIRLTGPVLNRNPLQEFVGPCDMRPESKTCLKEGVEFFNTTAPDCDGNIDIVFVGIDTAAYRECGPGLEVNHSAELSQVCAASDVPTETDRYRDLCVPEELSSSSSSEAELPETSSISSSIMDSVSSEVIDCGTLPHCEIFDNSIAEHFVFPVGVFAFEAHDSPGELCEEESSIAISDGLALTAVSGSSRNVAVWDACAYISSLNKKCVVELQITNNLPARNGGMVVNYHVVDPTGLARIEYFLVMLDLQRSKVRVLRFNGVGFIEEFATGVLPLAINDWYRLEVTTTAVSAEQVALNVTVLGVSNLSFPTTSFSLVTRRFLPDDGLFGVGTNNSYARFSFFRLEELP